MSELKNIVGKIKKNKPTRLPLLGAVVVRNKSNGLKNPKKILLSVLCFILILGSAGLAYRQYSKYTDSKKSSMQSNAELSRQADRYNELISAKKYIEQGDVSKLTESIIIIQSKTDHKTDIDLQYAVFMSKFLAKDYTSAKSELSKLKTIKNENPNQMSIFVLRDTVSQYEQDLEFKSLTQESTDAKAE